MAKAPTPEEIAELGDLAVYLADVLPRSAHGKIREIVDNLAPKVAERVEVVDARLPVETIEAYGLTITLDALGDAVSIASPAGFDAIGWE